LRFQPFDDYIEHTKRVSPTCLVNLERNRYSVPASFANRPVSVRVYADRVLVIGDGRIEEEIELGRRADHSAAALIARLARVGL